MESAAGILECSLCLSEYTDPRALPCLHTFCYRCLIQLFVTRRQDNKFKCPICQEQHDIPQNGAEGFRKDFRMKTIMEMKKTEGKSVRPTRCQSHPRLELTHFCSEVDCKGAVFCIHCARQKHRDHEIIPMKSICEAKLSHLKVMEEAIELNREKVQSARKKLSDNRIEIREELSAWMGVFHKQLDEVEKKNIDIIESEMLKAHISLNLTENEIQSAAYQLKILKTELSDTIPNIVQANSDKHLDEDLDNLCETLNNWSIKYSLLELVGQHPFKGVIKNWVVPLPSQSVEGVSVALHDGPTMNPSISSSPAQTSTNAFGITLPKKRKVERSPSSYYTSSDDDL